MRLTCFRSTALLFCLLPVRAAEPAAPLAAFAGKSRILFQGDSIT